jgi:succinate dehydrogenase / fumarate reductase, iron-sulfur subunit
MRCHLCTSSCPKNVRPSERIIDLKGMAIAAQGATELGSRHAVAFKNNIRERGLLSELRLVRETFGRIGMLAQLGQGIHVWRKKPEILKRPRPIAGMEEVEKIYRSLDESSWPK